MERYFFIGIACLFFCCDDKGQHFDHSDVVGNYKLTEWNAPIAVDLDLDGDSSRNLLNESDCFDNAEITIYSDGVFTKTYRSIQISDNTSRCFTEYWTGTWARTGDRLMLTWLTEIGEVSDVYNFGSVNERLTRTIENFNYPNVSENGQLYYETGAVNVVFTKVGL